MFLFLRKSIQGYGPIDLGSHWVFSANQRVHLKDDLGKFSSVIGRNQPTRPDGKRGRLVYMLTDVLIFGYFKFTFQRKKPDFKNRNMI